MELHWKIYLERQGAGERVTVGAVRRPVEGATTADFGLSLAEVTLGTFTLTLPRAVAKVRIRQSLIRRYLPRCLHVRRSTSYARI